MDQANSTGLRPGNQGPRYQFRYFCGGGDGSPLHRRCSDSRINHNMKFLVACIMFLLAGSVQSVALATDIQGKADASKRMELGKASLEILGIIQNTHE